MYQITRMSGNLYAKELHRSDDLTDMHYEDAEESDLFLKEGTAVVFVIDIEDATDLLKCSLEDIEVV